MTRVTFVDITGQRFGAWLVMHRSDNDAHGRARWMCRCDCGIEKIQRSIHLRQGRTTRCRRCSNIDNRRMQAMHGVRAVRAVRSREREPQPPLRCTVPTDWSRIGDEVLDLAEQGISRRKIAIRYGISKGAVAGWLNRNRDIVGYTQRSRSYLLPLEDVPEHLRGSS